MNEDYLGIQLIPEENRNPYPIYKRKAGRPSKEQKAYIALSKAWQYHNRIKYATYYKKNISKGFFDYLLSNKTKHPITKIGSRGEVYIKYKQRNISNERR